MPRKPCGPEYPALPKTTVSRPNVHVVGHPTAPIGMGEHVRSVFRALREAGEQAMIVDIYGPSDGADPELVKAYTQFTTPFLGDDVNIFCINADEVKQAFEVLAKRNLKREGSYNIVYPAWELAEFPDEWVQFLERFDEIWAASQFILDAIEPKTEVPVVHMPLACEVGVRGLYSRRHFGIPESSYCFLFAFDFLSYVERKNPEAVLEAFKAACDQRPHADVRLVLKLNNVDRKPDAYERFKHGFDDYKDRVVLIEQPLTDPEMKALMWNVDCFVSLHRSEGWGRGISEAMDLGKPAIATAYSGNLDFCTDETAFLIPHRLVPVGPGQYPYWEGQKWASADVAAAARTIVDLIDDPRIGERVGQKARSHMARHFHFLPRGLAYSRRIDEIWSTASAAEIRRRGKAEALARLSDRADA
jgi:glycosyltransferase involved in cell wall biosynthesis